MKGIILLATMVLLVCVATNAEAADFKIGSEPDGFRGIKWGTNIETLTGMTQIGTDPGYGGLEKYTRSGDELEMGKAKLSNVVYAFWRQQLFSVTMEATGSANCEALREATFKKYGFGHKTNLYLKDYYWLGPVTKMKYKKNTTTKDCLLYMASHKLMEEAVRYKREPSAEGTKKGF
jgi:hypothetical protein